MLKICDECFGVFESIQESKCPIAYCGGELHTVDSEIVFLLSSLNKTFASKEIPLRTIYSCSGHGPLNDGSFVMPYVGFGVDAETEKEFQITSEYYTEELFSPLVAKLNKGLAACKSLFTVQSPYEIRTSVVPNEENQYKYRLFISDLEIQPVELDDSLLSDRSDEEEIRNLGIVNHLHSAFDEFLLDIIYTVKTREFSF